MSAPSVNEGDLFVEHPLGTSFGEVEMAVPEGTFLDKLWGHLLGLLGSSHRASITIQHLTPGSHQQAGKEEELHRKEF